MSYASHSASDAITDCVTMTLLDEHGSASPVIAELSYRAEDPYAVHITFAVEQMHVTWTFARELLVLGATKPMGRGDVRVWPDLDQIGHTLVCLEISSGDGIALMQCRTSDLYPFIRRVLTAVPLGEESANVDLDAEVAALLV
jgi:hypothetical protein